MTSMPAAHFGLWDRGILRPGYAADVVVFDYDGLDDVSTNEHPHALRPRASSTSSSTASPSSSTASTPARAGAAPAPGLT